MVKYNCTNIPLHLLNQIIANDGQLANGQEYCVDSLIYRRNELLESRVDDLFESHMASLFEQAAYMVNAASDIIKKASAIIATRRNAFKLFFNRIKGDRMNKYTDKEITEFLTKFDKFAQDENYNMDFALGQAKQSLEDNGYYEICSFSSVSGAPITLS